MSAAPSPAWAAASGGLPRALGQVLRPAEAGLYHDAASALAAIAERAAAQHEAAERRLAEECARAVAGVERDARQEATRLVAEASVGVRRALAGVSHEIALAIADGVARVIDGLDLADAVARAARRAVADLEDLHAVTVRVAPQAAEAARDRLAGLGVRVLADPGLAEDGCVVESRAGFVRASLSEQVGVLRAALAGAADHA